MGDMPAPGEPELTDAEKKLVADVTLPILAGHVLMGTDMVASMGHQLTVGNNITINLEPDTRAGDRPALRRPERGWERIDGDAGHAVGVLGLQPRPLRRPVDVQLLRAGAGRVGR